MAQRPLANELTEAIKSNRGLLIGTIVAGVVLVVIFVAVLIVVRRARRRRVLLIDVEEQDKSIELEKIETNDIPLKQEDTNSYKVLKKRQEEGRPILTIDIPFKEESPRRPKAYPSPSTTLPPLNVSLQKASLSELMIKSNTKVEEKAIEPQN